MSGIPVRCTTETGGLPVYRTGGSAGADLAAHLEQAIVLAPGQRRLVPTGLRMQIPSGYELQVRPRSGLALEHGVTVLNSPGTVDEDYRGEIMVVLVNLGERPFTVNPGDRIAQAVLARVERAEFEAVDALEQSRRGAGGFGSAGLPSGRAGGSQDAGGGSMSHRTVNLYVTRELLSAVFVAFLFFFFIFFVNQLLLMAERILSKRVPLADVALLVLYSLPIIVTYALPFGTLVGALMAVSRLAGDLEIMALRASGVALARIFVPLLVSALMLSATAFVFNDLFLPLGNIGLKSMLRRVIFQNPAIELEPYAVKRYNNTTIITGRVEGRRIRPITIIDQDDENRKRVITASEAVLVPAADERGAVALELRDVFDHTTKPREKGDFEYATAQRMVYNILLKDISVSLVNPGPAEKSSVDVFREITAMRRSQAEKAAAEAQRARRLRYRLALLTLEAIDRGVDLPAAERDEASRLAAEIAREAPGPPPDRTLQGYLLEFHRKFASPLSCLAFMVFAFPAGLLARRSGRTLGFALGIVMSGLYWGMLIVSYRFGARATLEPMLAMWLPNAVVLAAGVALLTTRSHP